MEGHLHRVERLDVLREAVAHPLALGLEGAEHAVPDDQDARVVAVQVLLLRTVVHAVVAGRVEEPLDRPRVAVDRLGVQGELVEQVPGQRQEDHPGREEQRRRHPEQRGAERRPVLSQRGREVVVLRAVVHHVGGPEQPDPVVAAVVGVVGQVVGEEQDHPCPPRFGGQLQGAQEVDAGVDRGHHQLPRGPDAQVADAHGQARARVVALVAHVSRLVLVLVRGVAQRQGLQAHRDEEEGDCGEDQLLHGTASGLVVTGLTSTGCTS